MFICMKMRIFYRIEDGHLHTDKHAVLHQRIHLRGGIFCHTLENLHLRRCAWCWRYTSWRCKTACLAVCYLRIYYNSLLSLSNSTLIMYQHFDNAKFKIEKLKQKSWKLVYMYPNISKSLKFSSWNVNIN